MFRLVYYTIKQKIIKRQRREYCLYSQIKHRKQKEFSEFSQFSLKKVEKRRRKTEKRDKEQRNNKKKSKREVQQLSRHYILLELLSESFSSSIFFLFYSHLLYSLFLFSFLSSLFLSLDSNERCRRLSELYHCLIEICESFLMIKKDERKV